MKLSLIALAGCAAVVVAACGDDDRTPFKAPAPDTTFGNDAGADPSDAAPPITCVSQTSKAEPVELAMLLLMDRSDSMTGGSWTAARKAMVAFADTAASIETNLGLSVFPPDKVVGDQACNREAFAPVVPIAPLPGNSAAIKDAILSREPTGLTPMTPALEGSYDAMKEFLADKPDVEGIVVLVTDGDPQGCNSTIANVLPVVSAASAGTPRIRTFAIGMTGASFAARDAIAAAGQGAPTAFNASGPEPQKELLTALESVRAGALGCEYRLPAPAAGQGKLDTDSVEIAWTPSEHDPEQRFRKVGGLAQCGETAGGFYYDDPAAPRRIILCPASCDAIHGGARTAKVEVVLGCVSEIK